MNIDKYTYIYFLGIGGIGMSALARYFNASGKKVAGYDKTPSKLISEMQAEGIGVHFDDEIKCILPEIIQHKENSVIVITPAIPIDHKEWNYFKENNYTILKRSQVLGNICSKHKCLAVAGTHGKTTTSSLIAHIFQSAGKDPIAFLGGITQNYLTNLLLPKNSTDLNPVIVEADEYDRSFLTLYPDSAIITSTDPDHLDIYGSGEYMMESYNLFASQVKKDGNLIIKKGLEIKKDNTQNKFTYSLEDSSADYYTQNRKVENGFYLFDLCTPDSIIENIRFGLPGKHNLENAVAASSIALLNGITEQELIKSLADFKGVKRRFDYQIRKNDFIFIDDYAHHPSEIAACVNAVKELYPGKKITGVFQPHLYSRTRDFADGFSESLSLLDELYLLDIYPARELPIPGVSSQMLLDKVQLNQKKLIQKDKLQNELKNNKPQILLTIGAGDIELLVEPLKQALI